MSFLNRREQLSLDQIGQYTKSLDTLEFFLKNTVLQLSTFKRFQVFHHVAIQLKKSLRKFGNKLFKLWKDFLDRMNQSHLGITVIHSYFLEATINFEQYKLGLKVIQNSGLPQSISIKDYQAYLLYSAYIYNEYERYIESFESLNIALTLQSSQFHQSFFILKFIVLVSRAIGSKFDKSQFIRQFDRIKMFGESDLLELKKQNKRKLEQIVYQVELFQKICQNLPLVSQEIQFLKQNDMISLYNKGDKKNGTQLKKYIKRELKQQNCYRIKCTQVNNQPINNFQTVRDINKVQSVYKYDSKNKIMYFNNDQTSQKQMDQMINKICQMQRIIKNRPIQVKSQRNQDLMGQLRGGFGGGFGSLGSMLGMFSRGGR